MEEENTKKRLIMIIALGVFLIVFIIVFRFLTTGRVVVSTDIANGSLSLSKLSDGGAQKVIASGPQKLFALLHPGTYLAKVTSKSASMSQFVVVQARKTAYYKLNPANPTDVEPVATVNAYGL